MSIPQAFAQLLSSAGRPLSQINPGSDEVALPIIVADQAIELLASSTVAILGGDLLTGSEGGGLRYAFGSWSCNQETSEPADNYCRRSQQVARDYIRSLPNPKDAYIVFVISDRASPAP